MSDRYRVVSWPAMGPHPASHHIWDNEACGPLVGRYDTAEEAAIRADELNTPIPEPRMGEHPAVAFLLAAHQQAEETARAASSDSGGDEWTDGGKHGDDVHVRSSNSYVAIGPWGCGLSDGIRMHIASHDPAAALRRVAAERELLAEHQLFRREVPVLAGDCFCCAKPLPTEPFEMTWCGTCHDEDDVGYEARWHGFRGGPCRTVLLLAKGWGWEGQ